MKWIQGLVLMALCLLSSPVRYLRRVAPPEPSAVRSRTKRAQRSLTPKYASSARPRTNWCGN